MNNIVKNSLKFLIPLILGIALIWFIYRNASLSEIKDVLNSGVKWSWIVLSLFFALGSHILRGIRWRYQIITIKENPSNTDLVNSVFGGYAVNLILPRAGEFWRCNFISKRFNQPFATVLGTIFSERIVDLIMLILIASIAFISQSSFFMSFFDNNPTIAVYLITILRSPVFYIVMVLLVAAIIIFYHKTGNTRFTKKLKEIVNRIWFGIKTIKAMKHKWIFIFLTICIWLLYFVNFWVCMFAFEFSSHLNVFAALSIFVMGSLAVIVPVQGGMGAWHFMIITTMIFYGVGETQASTFALVVHAIQQGFVLLLGLYAFLAINIGDRIQKKKTKPNIQ